MNVPPDGAVYHHEKVQLSLVTPGNVIDHVVRVVPLTFQSATFVHSFPSFQIHRNVYVDGSRVPQSL